MEIRLIFFKGIVGLISLKNGLPSHMQSTYVRGRRNREEDFSSPRVSLISILQQSTQK